MAIHFDLVDLRLFVYIAEENNLTRGAARAHISVPAASMRMKNLEDALAVKLFNRESQGITLRPAGEALLHHARQMLRQLEHLNGDLQDYAKGIKGHIRLSANTTAINEFLPGVLASFLTARPDVNIDLREQLSNDIVRNIIDGTIDIGIVASGVHTQNLHTLPYRRDRLVLAVAKGHPLAARKAVSFAETLQYDFIGSHEGSAIHAFVIQAANELHLPLNIRIQVSSFDAICRMVEAGVGIGVLPESAARRHAKSMNVKTVELTDKWALRELLICVRTISGLPAFAKDLIELLVAESQAYEAGDLPLNIVPVQRSRASASRQALSGVS
jgi:DNA-binding transcriptional LysR family regulator